MKKITILIVVLSILGVVAGCTRNVDSPNQKETEVIINEENNSDVSMFKHFNATDINSEDAISLIKKLSSKEYNGRQAGTEENEQVEDLLVETFKSLGLESPTMDYSYKQVYTQLTALPVKATEISIIGSDIAYKYQVDFTESFEIGKTYYDADIKAKMITIDSIGQLNNDTEQLDRKVLLMTQNIYYNSMTWSYLNDLLNEGIDIEAIIVASVAAKAGIRVSRAISKYDDSEFEIKDPVLINASAEMFDDLREQSKQDAEIIIKMDYEVIESEVANIVGIIPGKNEVGDDETLIIAAHMDHVGNNMGGSFNAGALDNASGVGVVVELARLLSEGEQPEDTIIFALFSGEEDGLLGSKYFVENPPISYINDHTKMLNLDMVGSKKKVPLMLCTIDKNSKELASTFEKLSNELDIEHSRASYRYSDHANFADQEIYE